MLRINTIFNSYSFFECDVSMRGTKWTNSFEFDSHKLELHLNFLRIKFEFHSKVENHEDCLVWKNLTKLQQQMVSFQVREVLDQAWLGNYFNCKSDWRTWMSKMLALTIMQFSISKFCLGRSFQDRVARLSNDKARYKLNRLYHDVNFDWK